jgi:hypothetical protein
MIFSFQESTYTNVFNSMMNYEKILISYLDKSIIQPA